MTPADAILTAVLAIDASAVYLIRERMHLRAAKDGHLLRSSDLGPAASSPAAGPGERPGEVAAFVPAGFPRTTRPVAAYLGVDERTVRHWADAGKLLVTLENGQRVYDEASVRARKTVLNGGAQ
jgi:hypothetical protein